MRRTAWLLLLLFLVAVPAVAQRRAPPEVLNPEEIPATDGSETCEITEVGVALAIDAELTAYFCDCDYGAPCPAGECCWNQKLFTGIEAAGVDQEVQFKNNSALGGAPGLLYNPATHETSARLFNKINYPHQSATTTGAGTDGDPWASYTIVNGIPNRFVAGIFEQSAVHTLADDTSILCDEGATIRRASGSEGVRLFDTASGAVDRVMISGCTFDDNGLTVTEEDFRFEPSSSYTTISYNTWLLDATRAGSAPLGTLCGLDAFNQTISGPCEYIDVIGNTVLGPTGLAETGPTSGFLTYNSSHVTVRDNFFDEVGQIRHFVWEYANYVPTDWKVVNNTWVDNPYEGVNHKICNNTQITNVLMEGNTFVHTRPDIQGPAGSSGLPMTGHSRTCKNPTSTQMEGLVHRGGNNTAYLEADYCADGGDCTVDTSPADGVPDNYVGFPGNLVGATVQNDTDGSECVITSVTTGTRTNDRLNCTLAGGTDNDWDDGDDWTVVTNVVDAFQNVRIVNNVVMGINSNGIAIGGDGSGAGEAAPEGGVTDGIVAYNTIIGRTQDGTTQMVKGTGIRAVSEANRRITIIGNHVENTALSGIWAGGENLSISGNRLINNHQLISPDNSQCVAEDDPADCCTGAGTGTCSPPTSNRWGAIAIDSNTTDFEISDNYAQDAGTQAHKALFSLGVINLEQTGVTDGRILNNTIIDTRTGGAEAHESCVKIGQFGGSTTDEIHVIGNKFRGCIDNDVFIADASINVVEGLSDNADAAVGLHVPVIDAGLNSNSFTVTGGTFFLDRSANPRFQWQLGGTNEFYSQMDGTGSISVLRDNSDGKIISCNVNGNCDFGIGNAGVYQFFNQILANRTDDPGANPNSPSIRIENHDNLVAQWETTLNHSTSPTTTVLRLRGADGTDLYNLETTSTDADYGRLDLLENGLGFNSPCDAALVYAATEACVFQDDDCDETMDDTESCVSGAPIVSATEPTACIKGQWWHKELADKTIIYYGVKEPDSGTCQWARMRTIR